MKVENKVIIVTGGGSGMGRELVLNLLAKNAKVIAIDINDSGLKGTTDLAGANGKSLHTFVIDITNKSAVENLLNQSLSLHGHVDGIVNNAGIIQPFVRLNELSYEVIERVINVNLYGTIFMVKTFLPHLLSRPEAHIINISSMGGFVPVPGQTMYGASKAAVKLLTEGLHSELIDTNVKVTVVFPGAINTNITKNSGLGDMIKSSDDTKKQAGNILSPVAAAQMIVDGMEGDQYRIYVGKDSKFMDLLCRWKPVFAARLINKKMKSHLR
jgi:NAD(P)-dependent dehydrogenase (short-subunit alcohol dehydrogenase family)